MGILSIFKGGDSQVLEVLKPKLLNAMKKSKTRSLLMTINEDYTDISFDSFASSLKDEIPKIKSTLTISEMLIKNQAEKIKELEAKISEQNGK